jgi:pimeloyl-ACP methyl ester carboxylesterase
MAALLELGGVEAEEGRTPLAHGTLFHLEHGTGPPLVMLQGAGGGAANWYRLMAPLGAKRRVYAPELPGFGLSDPVATVAPLGASAADILGTWLDARLAGERVDLVATSFGGLVALRLALQRSDRIGRIVLLNATGLGRGVALPVRFAGWPLVRRFVEHPTLDGTRRLYRALLTSDRTDLPARHEDAIVEYAWRSALSGAGAELGQALARFAGPRGQREVLSPAELAGIEAPVLILWGGADRFLPPRHGPRAAASLTRARFHLLDGVGHSPNWECPSRVLAVAGPFLGIA